MTPSDGSRDGASETRDPLVRTRPPSLADLLEQTEVWWSRDEQRQLVPVSLDVMTVEHARRLWTWLLNSAEAVRYGVLVPVLSSIPGNASDGVADLADEIIGELTQPPDDWMRDRPFFRALSDKLDKLDNPVGVGESLTRTDVAVLKRLCRVALDDTMQHTLRQRDDARRVLIKLENGAVQPALRTRTRRTE